MSRIEFHLNLGENYYDPYEFVDTIAFAENLGFRNVWLGDHFVPWFHSGNRSAFVWSVISVALEKTKQVKIGPLVSTPIGGRYHPALIAQASATIDNMFPGRFLLGVGTGEAVNELPFLSNRWPKWNERMNRLTEGIELIRTLWDAREPFDFKGKFFSSDFYYLYTKPKTRIPIYLSAVGKKSAYCAGKYADHLVTLSSKVNLEKLRNELIPAFKQGCEDAHKQMGDVLVQLDFSFQSPGELLKSSKSLGFYKRDSWSLRTPVEVERSGDSVSVEDLTQRVHFCNSWDQVVTMIEDYVTSGATAIVLPTEAGRPVVQQFATNLLSEF